ncbi:MAG TPA: septum site-determining protein MinC [Polyangia bacterium]
MEATSEARLVEQMPAFDIKGTITPVTVLRLYTTDVERIERELRARIAPAPQMFANAPIVIDVADLPSEVELSLPSLVARLRSCKLVPVGVANASGDEIVRAVEAGLAIVQIGIGRGRGVERPGVNARPEPAAAAPAPAPTPAPKRAREERRPDAKSADAEALASSLTVKQPVRGGQVIYAQRADLVVLAPVNAGAQVIADGHVHVYGPLRGRALAGAQGMADARVFCQSLEAELVSVAGQYLLADEIPADRRGRPTQIFVENGSFHFLPL